jgi:hypothetical protein
MPRLARIEVRDTFAPNSPTILAVVRELLSAESEDPQPGMQHLTIEMPLSDQAVAHCVKRRVLRRVMDDDTWREYRISRSREVTGQGGARYQVTAVDPILDLADAEIIRDTLASGIVEFDIGLVQVTVTEIVDNQIVARLPAEYGHFARGTIEPTAKYDINFQGATPLAVLQIVAQAAADPTTHLPAEYQVRQTAAAFYIDVLAEIGSTQAVADVRTRKNLRSNTVSEDTDRMATVMVGFGADDGSGARTTIARAAWKLDNAVGLVYEITDPEGGPSPVLEDDQLNGMYVVPNGTGALVQITDSAAGSPATVTLASATGITEGEVYELRASAADVLVTEIDSPSKSAVPPTGYGRKMGSITREDLFGARNLIVNPWFRTWTTPASPPDGWTVTSGASGSTSQNTDVLYTEYGGQSWKVELPSVAGGVHTLKSPTFYPRPVNGASTFAVKAHLFLAAFSGDCFIELRVERVSSLLPPFVIKQFVPTDYPVASTAPRLATGDYVDIGIEGIDLSAAGTGGLQLHLVFYSHPSLGGAPGTITAYVDAVMLTQTPKVPPIWIEYSGSNALWHACNLALANNRDPIKRYDTEVLDLTRLDGTRWLYDELVTGATIRVTDRDGTVSNELVRIMAKPSINWLVEAETSLTLATRQQLLADLLNQSPGGPSVSATGPGSGASTPPTTPGPSPGPSPAPTPAPLPNAGRLLKTIWTGRKVLEALPLAETDIDGDDGEHFLVDFTGMTDVFLSGSVIDDDGSAASLAIKYLRPTDDTWRFLDGTSEPELPLDAAGLTIGASVALESDARGLRWCKVVSSGGDGSVAPIVGHLALHGGVASSSNLGDWAQLIAQLGGDTEVPFFYDFRYQVTLASGKVDAINDVRGSGFGPQLGSGADGDYDAIVGEGQFDNSEAMVSSAESSLVDLSGPFTLIYVGTIPGTGAGSMFVCGVGTPTLVPSTYLGIRAGASFVSGEALASGVTTTLASAVDNDPTAVRVCVISQDGGTGLTFDVPDDTQASGSLGAAMTATSAFICLMERTNAEAAQRGDGHCRAFIGVKHVLSATELAAVHNWALVFRGAATA